MTIDTQVLTMKKASRKKAYIKIGLSAPSGGGKTLSSLLLGYGMMKEKYPNEDDATRWSKIAIIDTENGSGELYVGLRIHNLVIGEYNAITIDSPYTAEKYITAIELCENNGIEVCIIDSTSHLWSGEGGLLQQHGEITKRVGNSWTAWRDITPMHNKFVEMMLTTPMHIIATMRSKQEYVMEKEDGYKTNIRKVGLEPEQRKGMEFEFTIFLEINNEHEAFGSKDRTSMFDQKTFVITPDVGAQIMKWINSGVPDTEEKVVAKMDMHVAKTESQYKSEIVDLAKELGGSSNEEVVLTMKKYHPTGNPNAIKDISDLEKLHSELSEMKP